MKKNLHFFVVIIICLTGFLVNAQSIHFASPTNGQTITNTGFGSTGSSVPVNFGFNYSVTPYPPRVNIYTGIKLITPSRTYDSREEEIPQWFYLESNTYTWRVELWEFFLGASSWEKTAEETISFYVKYKITVSNNFYAGTIKIDNVTTTSGSIAAKFTGNNLLVGAID